MSGSGVLVDVDGGVLRLTIDRPDRKGSLDPPSVRRLAEALEEAATDDSLRAVLLSSAADVSRTGDFREGLAAFKERRDPEIEGR